MDHPTTIRDSYYLEPAQWARGRNAFTFLALVASIACLFGFFQDPAQFYRSYLVGFVFCVTIGLGAMFFVMVQYLTGSAWSVTVRRFMENIMMTLPVGALLFIPVAFGLPYLYSWMDRAMVMKDPVLVGKAGFLSQEWFIIRAVIYFVIWSFFAIGIYRQSTKQDREHSIQQMHVASRFSAPGLLLVFLTGTLASFDWLMSLDPRWYSTIFGIYTLAGGAVAFMATTTLIALGFRKFGMLKNSITEEHYHDLGKWMFALTVFWAYIAFSQYLLIWYANIPEETIWYRHRFEGSWIFVSFLVLFGRFIIPFAVLLSRGAKRNYMILGGISIWILFMHFVDLYWLIMPNFFKSGVALHWLDFACLAAVISVFALAFWFRLRRNALVTVGDMRFEQGLHFENI